MKKYSLKPGLRALLALWPALFFLGLFAGPMTYGAYGAEKPEIFVQLGHQDSVRFASFSAGGKYLVTGSDDKTVKLWDAGSGSEVRTFVGHTARVTAAAVSSDGRLVVSGDDTGAIKIWDAADGRQIKSLNVGGEHKGIRFLNFSPNDKVFSSVSISNGATIWNAASGQALRTVPHTRGLPSFASGEKFVLAGKDGSFNEFSLIELATGRETLSFKYENYSIRAISISGDGRYGLFASSGSAPKSSKLELRDMTANKSISEWTVDGGPSSYYNVALSPDGRYALTVEVGGAGVTLWDAFTGKKLRQITTSYSTFAAFSPDGRSFITLGNYVPTLWDTASGNILRSFARRSISLDYSVSLSPDGREARVDGNPNPAFLVDTATGATKKVFAGYSSVSRYLDNGRHLVMVDDARKKLVLWNTAEGRIDKELSGMAAYYSDDGRYLAEKISQNTVKVWEIATGKELMSYMETAGNIGKARLSANNKKLVITGDRTVKLIDVETGVEGRSFTTEEGHSIWSAETSADGQYLIVHHKGGKVMEADQITIWETDTGRKIETIIGVFVLNSYALSPDGRTMLVLLQDYEKRPPTRTMSLYEIATGKKIRAFTGLNDAALAVFSPDGKSIFSGSNDGIIRQWDAASGRVEKTFAGHKSGIQTIAISPDGKRLVTCGNDGPLRFWDIAGSKEIAQLVNFTDGEWIMITPEGYFNASPKGAQYLNVRIGNQVYSIDSLYEKFFNPVYVATVLQGKKVEAADDLRKGILTPPDVKIVSPEANASFNKDTVSITVAARDTGGGIGEVRLYHNGKVVGEDQRAVKIVPQKNALTKTYSVTLVEGQNTFRATGFSRDRTESNPYELVIRLTAPQKDASLYVLVVGVNRYQNPALNLNYAEPDARGIADFFRQKGKGLFKTVQIGELYNEQATKQGITAKLKGLAATNPQDVVLIYLAGHGESLADQWYFLPREVIYPEREGEIKAKGLSSDELSGFLKNIQAQKILMLIDACKSGAVLVSFRGFEDRKALSQLSRSAGVHVIAASTKDQFASEVKDLGHGVFTYTILEGLKGKAAGGTETVTVRKLMGYVEEQLPDLTKKYKQEAQYPVVDSRGMDFPLVIIK